MIFLYVVSGVLDNPDKAEFKGVEKQTLAHTVRLKFHNVCYLVHLATVVMFGQL